MDVCRWVLHRAVHDQAGIETASTSRSFSSLSSDANSDTDSISFLPTLRGQSKLRYSLIQPAFRGRSLIRCKMVNHGQTGRDSVFVSHTRILQQEVAYGKETRSD